METLLKEIVLEGFKSFRDKTSLKFDGPFTVIVGPNGSGKSNVVDAIKWVLGDPSPRSIRASTGLETIYRPADGKESDGAGYASVIMKVDNSQPATEGEPTEWEIERRYYRSGESVYSLNGKTARLKDVRALMAQKGFGLGSLSVVSQGEVDGFLSLVPNDRRLVFEDLARISEFKTNKRKILGQLDDCSRNDERLRDLLGELLVRVDVLTAQAEAARRHADLSKSVNDVEAQLAAQEYLLARRNIERNENRQTELFSEVELARSLRDDKAHDLSESKLELENARQENSATLIECEQGRRELDRAIAEERRLTDANQYYSKLISAHEGELKDRELRAENLGKRQDDLREIAEFAEAEKYFAERSRLDFELYLYRRWGYLRACERERERLATKVERLQGKGSFFTRDAEFHSRRAEALKIEADGLAKKLDVLRVEINKRNSLVEELDAEYKSLKQKHGEFESVITTLRVAISDLKVRRDSIRSEKLDLSVLLTALESEIKLLRELDKSMEGYGEGARAIIDRRDRFPGLRGTLGELITVEPGKESKIEKLLGDSIGYLIVDTLDQALTIIRTAKTENLGAVTCIVLDLVPDNINTGDSKLLDACSTDSDITKCLAMLLLDVSEADSFSDIHAGFNKALITTDEIIFRPPAFVSGASVVSTATGVLTRKARIAEIEKLFLRNRWKEATCIAREYQLECEIGKLALALAEAEQQFDEVKQNLQINITSSHKHAEWLESANLDLKEAEIRLEKITVERDGCLENARLASMGTEAVKRARADSEKSLEWIESQLPRVNEQVEELRSRLQRAIVESASYREETDRARQEIKRLDQDISSIKIEIANRKKSLDDIYNEARSTSTELDSAAQKRIDLEASLPELEQRERDARERIEASKNKVDALEIELEDARGKVASVENAVHQQEVRLAELKGAIVELEKDLDAFPELAERIKGGDLQGRDIPSKKELSERLTELKFELDELGEVNALAIEEERLARQRLDDIKREREDLILAADELRKALDEIERESEKAFSNTFKDTAERFAEVFASLFPGGFGELSLTEPGNPLDSGIDVKVKFPGKGEMDVLQFSGGERALIALALLFAILKVKPSSFTLLDEVEAALDDVNTQKFLDYLGQEFPHRQFIIITHNKITMERANRLYGVTMGGTGISQVVSVDLRQLKDSEIDQVLGRPN